MLYVGYDGYQKGLAFMVYNFFDKKTSGEAIKSIPNQRPWTWLCNNLQMNFINQLFENFKKKSILII